MRKPRWVIEKEQAKAAAARETVWLFGLHAVREALENPRRERLRLILTPNAALRLQEAVAAAGMEAEVADPRRFPAPLDPGSVHQGAALEVRALDWGGLQERCVPGPGPSPLAVALDRITDPHNVGAILRSAEVFGACAVIAPRRHAAPETGALAKSASGAMERQPYLRVPNLSQALRSLAEMGYHIVGLDGTATDPLDEVVARAPGAPLALVLGAEGPGLREGTKAACDGLAAIPASGSFGSLNVSNAAAIALYIGHRHR